MNTVLPVFIYLLLIELSMEWNVKDSYLKIKQ